MRLSEVLALRWENIDFTNKHILVYTSSHYSKKKHGGGHHTKNTKENEPKSYIKISDEDVMFLKQHRKSQAEHKMKYRAEYKDNGLVFTKKDGTYLRNDTVSKAFTKFAQSINIDITFHGLWHTHCTLLIAAGVPSMFVAERTGHKKVSTVDDMYNLKLHK
jgi:integrase